MNRIKKYLITLTITGLISIYSFAQTINEHNAKRVAKNFFYERINQLRKTPYETIEIKDIRYITKNDNITLYIFNFENGGFVFVSASDRVVPVIGYSFNGYFTDNDQPPQLAEYIDKISNQINYVFNNYQLTENIYEKQWKHLLSYDPTNLKIFNGDNVEPLLTTTWNQGKYYNEMCPADPAGPGGHCYAGCVATAMGQVMNYFRFPLQGTGSYSYECPPYGTLSADFGNTNYRWNQMPLYLSRSNLSVAELLYHLGVSVDMVYGPDGSGMYNHKAAYSLRTYFNYSSETEYLYRDSTSMDWDSVLVEHLDREIPMYYAGWSVPNVNGHAFVCDGYQSSDYFHFNWGWGGSFDGYFYTDNLTPGGSNFNLAQEVIINCYPDTVSYDYPYYCTGKDTLTTTAGVVNDGSGHLYDYPDSTYCRWLIAPEDSVNNITCEFLNLKTDTNDILTIYDGDTTTNPVLGKYSGSETPSETITSTGDKMLIVFESDNQITDEGWLISYDAEIPIYCEGLTKLVNQADTFSDGSGPRNYHNGTACLWNIEPEGASEITLTFLEFETEADNDIVQVYDGIELMAELSGDELPDPLTATSGTMFVSFSSNSSVTAPGWKACYETDLVSIKQIKESIDFYVYPNPASEKIFLETDATIRGDFYVCILSMEGKELIKQTPIENNQHKYTIDISTLPQGVYILSVKSDQFQLHKKIVIK